MIGLSEQRIVVTGAASGLARALAARLVEDGNQVAGLDIDEAGLEEMTGRYGSAFSPYALDLVDAAEVDACVREIAGAWNGRIDGVANCAGITGRTGVPSHKVEGQDFDRVFAVNVRAIFNLCKAVIPVMRARGYGRILNVASIAGKEGNAGMLAYSSSKAAVIGMTKVMGKEYAEQGITVNAVAPAVIRTAMVEKMPEDQVEYMTSRIPMKRCGTLEEFVDLARFILSPDSSFTTGFAFDLSGGRATY